MVWDTHTVSLDPGLTTSPSSVMHYFCTNILTQKSDKFNNCLLLEKHLTQRNGNGREGLPTPHPTLIGGKDPQVQMAGLVKIRGGKIISYDNRSGHYKPNIKSISVADEAFGKLPASVFKNKKGG